MDIKQKPFDIYNLLGELAFTGDQLAKDLGKGGCHIRVELPDGLVLEKDFYDALSKSLVHLVRNSIDHGLEIPQERVASGKSEKGEILFSLGENSALVYSDDGRGINVRKIREKAEKQGIKVGDEAAELVNLIFDSGFSTADQVTDISGRGVGMSAVRQMLEDVGSGIEVQVTSLENGFAKFNFLIKFPKSSPTRQDGVAS